MSVHLEIIQTIKPTNALRLKLYVLHIFRNSDMFRSILIIFRELLNFHKSYTKTQMCVLIFSTNLSETFLILRRNEGDIIKYKCFHVRYPYSCQILMELKFSLQTFEKCSYTKLHENPFIGCRVVSCRQTDRQKGMTKLIVAFRFSKFCEGA